MMPGDLELSATVDGTVRQNVPIPPQTNSVLSGMISSAKSKSSASSSSSPNDPSPSSSSYAPSSPLPSCLQFERSSHPTACLFHVLFKCLALAMYVLGSRTMEGNMATVMCVLLLAADFWVVKNVTGRLLVGLRWWNMVDPATGETSWIFESASPATATTTTTMSPGNGSARPTPASANAFDSRFFWSVLYLTPAIWCALFLSAALWLQFQCLVTLTCALVLSASNVYGYYKCSSDQRRRWNEWMNAGATMGMTAMMRNSSAAGWLFGGAAGRQRVPQQDPNIMTGTFA
ncbi:hypothetical protein ACHAW5_007399 [Stephanodiscus triporus]|uniref:Golgi apparatus membrane protein TVP23 homolog n=1 Tax=Stephanodiscus triporus TaxID=2934178 RepID=A0ABD3QDP5_9STRA